MDWKRIVMTLGVAGILQLSAATSRAQSVTMWHNDLGRTGSDPSETTLNTSNVNRNTFGKLYALPVDNQIYAQPLYVTGVNIGGTTHNVLYVATMGNSVYAFDADSSTPEVLWQVNLGTPVPSYEDILTQIGILSTPVIDINLNAIFLVADTYQSNKAVFSLHSLDIRTGQERVGSPVFISGTVAGTGVGSNNGSVVFNPNQNLQRPGLLELNGNIYMTFGSHADQPPYNGWIFAYNNMTLRRLTVKCTSPNGYGSSIWQGGAAPAADSSGNIYFSTGNGDFNPLVQDYGDSVLKLSASAGLALTSSFTPEVQLLFEEEDADLGASGAMVLPGSPLLTAPMVLAASKDGHFYLLNSATLGGYNPVDQVVQEFQLGFGYFGASVYYNNLLYTWGNGDVLRIFSFGGTGFTQSITGTFATPSSYRNSPAMSLSANGLTPGTPVLWAAHSQSATDGGNYPGLLHAYDAVTGNELWNSTMNPGDYPGAWSKWTPPTIANGKVYLATFDSGVAVYGLK
jgi:hypothetical protein